MKEFIKTSWLTISMIILFGVSLHFLIMRIVPQLPDKKQAYEVWIMTHPKYKDIPYEQWHSAQWYGTLPVETTMKDEE